MSWCNLKLQVSLHPLKCELTKQSLNLKKESFKEEKGLNWLSAFILAHIVFIIKTIIQLYCDPGFQKLNLVVHITTLNKKAII